MRCPRTGLNALTDNHRAEKFTQRAPHAVGPFIAVERFFTCGALAPAFSSIGVGDSRQHNASFSGAAEARFEEVDQWQADFAQFNRLNNQWRK
jgi:hypothetical protein